MKYQIVNISNQNSYNVHKNNEFMDLREKH